MPASDRIPSGVLILALSAPAGAQAPARPQPLVVRIGVDLVQIDAVVTDRSGRHVTDLTAEDFEILQDEKAHPVSHLRYVVAETAPAQPLGSVASDDIPPAFAPLRPEQVKRSMAFVVGPASLAGIVATRAALKKLIDEDLREGDLVAIVRARDGMGILQQFTSDRRALRAAADDLLFNPLAGDFLCPGTFVDAGGYCRTAGDAFHALPWTAGYRHEWSTATLNAITFALESLRELPGRKSVVVIAETLSLFQPTDMLGRPSSVDPYIIDAARQVTDLANRGSVVIYTIDPGGLRPDGPAAAYASRYDADGQLLSASDLSPFAVPGSATLYGNLLWHQAAERRNAQSGLEVLARQTGGLLFRNENRVDTAVKDVVEDQKGYYVLGYVPDEGTFERSKRGPLFHDLKVRVKRDGLRVRSRAGFVGVTDDDDVRPAPSIAGDQLLRAMVSPFAADGIPVRLTAVFGHDGGRGYVVRCLLHVDASRLTLAPHAEGGSEATLEVGAALFGENGGLSQAFHQEVRFRVTTEALERVQREGAAIQLNVPVKKPGAYQFRVAVRDAAAATIGTAHQFLDIPDLSTRRLALSGLVVGRAPHAMVEEAPAPAPASARADAGDDARMSAARRRFSPGAELSYAVAIYHPKVDRTSGQPRLDTRLRLVRDGQEVMTTSEDTTSTLAALPAPVSKKARNVHGYMMTGTVRLPPSLEPGDYALQVVVTDALARSKTRRARWTDLEVVSDAVRVSAAR